MVMSIEIQRKMNLSMSTWMCWNWKKNTKIRIF